MFDPENAPLPSPESTQEKEKIFEGVFFTAIRNKKEEIIGYKSSDRGRKIIELPADASIEEGKPYKVAVREDTNPEDSMSGKYVGEIVFDSPVANLEEWQGVEENVRKAEESERKASKASVELYGETGLQQKERGGLSEEEIVDKSEDPEVSEVLVYREDVFSQEASSILGDENSPEQALVSLQRANLIKALREERNLEGQINKLNDRETSILKKIKGEPSGARQEALENIRQKLSGAEKKREALYTSSPEAFYGLHLKDLKNYKEDLEEGKIVETPYVKKQIEDVVSHVRASKPVLIYGHLGSGKTELAMHIARNYILKDRPDIDERVEGEIKTWLEQNPNANSEDQEKRRKELNVAVAHRSALVISGSKDMSPAELYGHQVLDIAKVKKEELDKFVQDVEQKYREWVDTNKDELGKLSPDEREQEKNRAHDRLLQTYLTQFKGGTISDFFIGPIYQAMEEGRPVIIDEVNAIPHEVLISLNHVLTRRAGDEVNVQQDSGKAITIAEGYGVIMTGNFNQEMDRYIGRQAMDPAFLSRLHKIEYDYLPQSTEGTLESEAGEKNELYHLLLARVIDKHGNLEAPEGTPEKLWNLAKAARITQNVYAGKDANNAYYFKEAGGRGIQYMLKESVLSLRNMDTIIWKWQKDGYKREIDYYIYKEFIEESKTASDRAYLYQLFKDQFGFFAGKDWEQNPNYGRGGVVASFTVNPPENQPDSRRFYGPRDTVEFAYGKPPERAKWPEMKVGEGAQVEVNQEIFEFEEFKNKLERELAELKEEIDQSCPVN